MKPDLSEYYNDKVRWEIRMLISEIREKLRREKPMIDETIRKARKEARIFLAGYKSH